MVTHTLKSRLGKIEHLTKPTVNFPNFEMFHKSQEENRQWHIENNPTYDPDELMNGIRCLEQMYDEKWGEPTANPKVNNQSKFKWPAVYDDGENNW